MQISWRDETLHFTDDGSGDPVLFLHGLGGNANNWLNQRTSISRHHRVITIDLPGHGRSTGRTIGFEHYAPAVDAVLRHLDVNTVSVVGLAMGGRVGIALAALLPDRVSRLTLVNTYLDLPPQQQAERVRLYDLLLQPGGDRQWAAKLLDGMGVTERPGIVRGFTASLGHIDPRHIHTVFRQLLLADQTDELRALAIPIQIMAGRRDRLVPAESTQRLRDLVPSAQLHSFRDSGHLPYLEEPAVFNDALEAFLHHRIVAPPSTALPRP